MTFLMSWTHCLFSFASSACELLTLTHVFFFPPLLLDVHAQWMPLTGTVEDVCRRFTFFAGEITRLFSQGRLICAACLAQLKSTLP